MGGAECDRGVEEITALAKDALLLKPADRPVAVRKAPEGINLADSV